MFKHENLNGRVAVVTGGGGVLCSGFAKDLAAQGVKVAVLDLNKDAAEAVAEEIRAAGGTAMGISGMDGGLITARTKDERLGFVGEITKVNAKPIEDLLEKGYIPVVSTVGSDMNGNSYNINADTAAACIAGALGAEGLLMMTDIEGVLKDPSDSDSLIPVIDIKDAENLKADGTISGGMIPKVDCCIDALVRGVKKVFVLDGRVPHSVLIEILTDEGAGTMFVKERKK